MDTSTIIITAIMLAMFILPVILTGRSYKKKTKKLYQTLNQTIEQQGYTLSLYEICDNFFIGIDENANTLFFYKHYDKNEKFKVIKLSDISGCQLINKTKNVNTKHQQYSSIELLELALNSVDKNRPDTLLEFYNTEYDNLNMTEELKIAEKWKKLINDKIIKPDKFTALKGKKIV
ncbi:MAG: hypothetical protein PHN68_01720 [Prolixibacteraceae bacterium]|nr:hypothetical protein [Prolixibacteraceae bacterium]MDD4756193.1 hypothetical protein [Prolixibacteraceae bacterium]NLO01631.1 hypothetical protein [Bacteroidales bacterium]